MFYADINLRSVENTAPCQQQRVSTAITYPDPLPNTVIVALLELCPGKTTTCFGCRKDLRTFVANSIISKKSRGLVIVTKVFRPIKRSSNGDMVYTKDLRNAYFHVSQYCVSYSNAIISFATSRNISSPT